MRRDSLSKGLVKGENDVYWLSSSKQPVNIQVSLLWNCGRAVKKLDS